MPGSNQGKTARVISCLFVLILMPMSTLPGDPSSEATVHRMIRVDHAGEYGAARIYAGQLAVLGKSGKADLLRHMRRAGRSASGDLQRAGRRATGAPTALLPLWHLAGFALGAATAALGERAAMACTVAVEETIDAHYTGADRATRRPGNAVARHAGKIPRRGTANTAISRWRTTPNVRLVIGCFRRPSAPDAASRSG